MRQIQAETDFYISFETLRTLTGRDYDELATLSEQLPIVNPDPMDEEAWVRPPCALILGFARPWSS